VAEESAHPARDRPPHTRRYRYPTRIAKSPALLRVRDPSSVASGIELSGGSRRLAWTVAVSVIAVCAGVAAATSNQLSAALIVVAVLCLFIGYATGHPRGAAFAMFASLALIPVYAVPAYRYFSPEPTAVAAVIVALAFVRVGAAWRFTFVDVAFATTCGAMLLAAALGPHSLLATLSELFLWIPAYVAGRAICRRHEGARTFAIGAAAAGLIALPFIAYETITEHNLFFSLARPGTELTSLWARPAFRPGGLLRSQGAFGHPLSMAFIVGSCSVFALALAVRSSSRGRRLAWLLAATGLAIGQYTSHERSGWIVIIAGTLIFAVTVLPGQTRLRHVVSVVVVIAILSIVAISASNPGNRESDVLRSGSTADRVALWRHAFEPGALGLVGLPETVTSNEFANAVRPGQVAIDSGFLQVGDVFGVLAFVGLFTVVAAVIRIAVAVRGTWAAIVPAVALADLIALTVIGFQTQVPIFAWLVVGAASGVDLRRRTRGHDPEEV
jgi:hypothetical protein